MHINHLMGRMGLRSRNREYTHATDLDLHSMARPEAWPALAAWPASASSSLWEMRKAR
jgi:hypothetical protein